MFIFTKCVDTVCDSSCYNSACKTKRDNQGVDHIQFYVEDVESYAL